MVDAKRLILGFCYACGLTVLVASCGSFTPPGTDLAAGNSKSKSSSIVMLPPEHVGDVPLNSDSFDVTISDELGNVYGLSPERKTLISSTPFSSISKVSLRSLGATPEIAPLSQTKTNQSPEQIALGPEDVVALASLTNEQIDQLQQGLIVQGFNPDRLSGVIGEQTEDALGAFMAYNYPGLPLQRRVLEILGVSF